MQITESSSVLFNDVWLQNCYRVWRRTLWGLLHWTEGSTAAYPNQWQKWKVENNQKHCSCFFCCWNIVGEKWEGANDSVLIRSALLVCCIDRLQGCGDPVHVLSGNKLLLDPRGGSVPPQPHLHDFLLGQKVSMGIHSDWMGWVLLHLHILPCIWLAELLIKTMQIKSHVPWGV